MAILAFDIGGTFVKYGVYVGNKLAMNKKIDTPKNWQIMKNKLNEIKVEINAVYKLKGVAFSVPGSVNKEKGQIEGESFVSYLHNFPIYEEVEELFNLPVSFENDANCGALAELYSGAAQDTNDFIFIVIGTGIGGTIILDRKIVKGNNNYAGEFGFMLMNDKEEDFGHLATAKNVAREYNKKNTLENKRKTGKEVFELAGKGDTIALEVVTDFFVILAKGIYNLNTVFNPQKIIIGGGVSNSKNFKENINYELANLNKRIYNFPYEPLIEIATFKNNANLIGAALNFINDNE